MGEKRTLLASFSGEIGTKKPGARKDLQILVVKNLKSRAAAFGVSVEIEDFHGRLKVVSEEGAEALLRSHFGLGKLAELYQINETFDWQILLPERPFTFEIYVDRWESPEQKRKALTLKNELLSLLEKEAEAKLSRWDNHPPEHLRLFLEARKEGLFLLKLLKPGPGGLPVGSGGRVLLLFSGGPDSLLSAWLLLRRGLEVVLLFFDDGDRGRKELVEEAAKALTFFYPEGELSLFRIPYRDHLEALGEAVPARERCFYCKALMLKLAEGVLPEVGAESLATGDLLGEQASQTIKALSFISAGRGLILRPVLALTKEEIFARLAEVGLKEVAERGLPPCRFAPERPRTTPRKAPFKAVKILRKLARIPTKVESKKVKWEKR